MLLMLFLSSLAWQGSPRASPIAAVSTPCADNADHQFDFWIGNWDIVEVEHPSAIVAHARIEAILKGCVLHEIFEGVDGHGGESFSIYDATRRIWHQSWVTDHGQLLTIEGEWRNGAICLQGADHLPDGTPRLVRGQWRAQDSGVREVAARSSDAGVTWVPWFDLLFRPHISSQRPRREAGAGADQVP
jgi:hypothetical protein